MFVGLEIFSNENKQYRSIEFLFNIKCCNYSASTISFDINCWSEIWRKQKTKQDFIFDCRIWSMSKSLSFSIRELWHY